MTIVMGLDQHRAQITAEWVDTDTGEVRRARVAPADRAGVRRFLQRFRGLKLDVAPEATTGWRFLVEELRRVGAGVHLAEPTETAALRGNKKRPKNDRADARHLRELLLARQSPESWIPPAHILDLRARIRLRHKLSEQRSEWQQRIQSVLYHHGGPQRHTLAAGEGRQWLESQPLPVEAREQITVALQMIDFLELQLHPLDLELRSYARRQTGCKALIAAHYGVGQLTSVTILAELWDCQRFSSSREAVRYGGLDVTVRSTNPTITARPGIPPGRDRRRCGGRCTRPPTPPGKHASPDHGNYLELAERLGGNRACLVIARKLLKRRYHALRELGEEALRPPTEQRPSSEAARRASSGTICRPESPATSTPTDELAA